MALDYLKFVESHEQNEGFNVFEKVLMATQRAKAIYEEEKARTAEESDKKKTKKKSPHKPTYLAILEINEGKLALTYSEKSPVLPVEKSPKPEKTPAVSEHNSSE